MMCPSGATLSLLHCFAVTNSEWFVTKSTAAATNGVRGLHYPYHYQRRATYVSMASRILLSHDAGPNSIVVLLRGTLVNRTYGRHQKSIYFPIFSDKIWSYLLRSPVVVVLTHGAYIPGTVVEILKIETYLAFLNRLVQLL